MGKFGYRMHYFTLFLVPDVGRQSGNRQDSSAPVPHKEPPKPGCMYMFCSHGRLPPMLRAHKKQTN